ncbi:MAG: redoxin domain-containing protein [Acidimicrobiales bacterium]|nr:redoxin domain-containing protein [Acidimicrobiales bacterium]
MTAPEAAPRRSRAVLFTALAVGVVLVALVALLVTRDTSGDRPSTSPVVGQQAPALGGDAIIGEPYDIGTTDRWLLVNFFATWCVPCRQEHPELRQFADDTSDGTAEVVSVVYGDDPAEVERFFEENGGDWTVLDADDGRTALDWGVAKVPESFLVSPTGVVVQRIQGGVVAEDIEALIAELED